MYELPLTIKCILSLVRTADKPEPNINPIEFIDHLQIPG